MFCSGNGVSPNFLFAAHTTLPVTCVSRVFDLFGRPETEVPGHPREVRQASGHDSS